jgi:hypothetical protein
MVAEVEAITYIFEQSIPTVIAPPPSSTAVIQVPAKFKLTALDVTKVPSS